MRVFLAAALSHEDANGAREFAYENRDADLASDFCGAFVFVGNGGVEAWAQRKMAEAKAEWEAAFAEDYEGEEPGWGEWTEETAKAGFPAGWRVWQLDGGEAGVFVLREAEADEE